MFIDPSGVLFNYLDNYHTTSSKKKAQKRCTSSDNKTYMYLHIKYTNES